MSKVVGYVSLPAYRVSDLAKYYATANSVRSAETEAQLKEWIARARRVYEKPGVLNRIYRALTDYDVWDVARDSRRGGWGFDPEIAKLVGSEAPRHISNDIGDRWVRRLENLQHKDEVLIDIDELAELQSVSDWGEKYVRT